MIKTTQPLNDLELIRIKRGPKTVREEALLATMQEITQQYARDCESWARQNVQMQMYRADAERKMKCFVQMLSTMAMQNGNKFSIEIGDMKKIEGSLFEIRAEDDKKTLTFELKDAVLLIKKAEEKNPDA